MALSADTLRVFDAVANFNEFPIAASSTIYKGSAVGLVDGTGLARALNAADRFAGFSEHQVVNVTASARNIMTRTEGLVQLSVTGAVITDVGQPVFATDDATFRFIPTAGVFIGFVHRFISAGVVVVEFKAGKYLDPYADFVHETKSLDYTVAATDAAKWLWLDTDAKTITLPAVEGIAGFRIGNIGAFGAILVTIAPNALDMIEGPDITAADNKALLNTKATARRGDYLEIQNGDANGWSVTRKRGTWVRQA